MLNQRSAQQLPGSPARHRRGRARAVTLAMLGALGALFLVAQRRDRALSQTTVLTVSNEFITAAIETMFTAGSGTTAATGPGDFGMATSNGDPLNAADNLQQLLLNQANGLMQTTSFATLRIFDDFQGQALTNSFRDMQIRGAGTTMDGPAPPGGGGGGGGGGAISSNEQFSPVSQPGVSGANEVVAIFQTLPTTAGGGGGGGGGTTITGRGWLVRRTVKLVRNMFEIKYEVTNRDAATRRAGLRMLFDTHPGGANSIVTADNGAPFFVPSLGLITTEREFTATTGIPSDFFITSDIANPRVLAQAVVAGSAAVTPNKVQVINRVLHGATLFDYQITAGASVTSDSGYTLTWDAVPYQAGQTRTFTTYYGLGFATGEYSAPFALATRSPTMLNQLPGPDPINPAPNQLFHFQPGSFNIVGSVYNFSTLPLSNIALNINLPTGLQLVAGETVSKTIATAQPLQDASVTWRVQASSSNAGALQYSINASVPLLGSKAVTRTIGVPALPQDIPVTTDVQMISFPFTFPNPSPDQVLTSQLTGRLIPSAELRLATYDTRANDYARFPTDLTALNPGTGYWIRSNLVDNLRLGDATNNPPRAVSTIGPFSIPLRRGWNMIGNPFLLPVSLSQLEVAQGNLRVSWQEAGQRGMIRAVLFSFQRGRGNVTADYLAISALSEQLVPRMGFWLFADDDVQLVVPTPQFLTQLQSRILRPSATPLRSEHDWRLKLMASTPAGSDFGTIGISATGNDLYDAGDLAKPPPFGEPVQVSFMHPNWGRYSGRYALDVRQPFSGRKSWTVDVEVNQAGEGPVTLTWPEAERLSRRMRFLLTDLTTNQTVSLRLERAYVFTAPAGVSQRRFRVTVETGGVTGNLRLQLHGAQVQSNGVTLPFTATEAGTASLLVMSPTGKVVNAVLNEAPITAGLNTVHWSGKNQRGLSLPRGVYILRLTARGESGARAEVVKSIQIK